MQNVHWSLLGKVKIIFLLLFEYNDFSKCLFDLGAAYAQAENELNKLVKHLKLPFLPTPMGKRDFKFFI